MLINSSQGIIDFRHVSVIDQPKMSINIIKSYAQ